MSTAPAASRRGPPPPVSWRSWPLEEGGLSAWLLSAIAVSMIVAVGLTTGSVEWALIACGVLAASAWRFFVPTHYELNAQGVLQEIFGRRRRIALAHISRARSRVARECTCGSPAPVSDSAAECLFLGDPIAHEVVACVDYYLTQARQPDRVYGFEIGR